ncbi:hypothetical protein [Shewanella sp. YLB-07]|uniref:hypothetical protein n=1 Tax=Shewanella sp. YLB-07 TaxID=2601268 RepID=UPI00128D4068|nr:hypothetical protein [Shewanella sp. YLB-07]MPY24293.1 hypothetical protein [Shewanella sp. YLB-07]
MINSKIAKVIASVLILSSAYAYAEQTGNLKFDEDAAMAETAEMAQDDPVNYSGDGGYAQVKVFNSTDQNIEGVAKYKWCGQSTFKLSANQAFRDVGRNLCLISSIEITFPDNPDATVFNYHSSGTSFAEFVLFKKGELGQHYTVTRNTSTDDPYNMPNNEYVGRN